MKNTSDLPRFDLADKIERNMKWWKCERPTLVEKNCFSPTLIEIFGEGVSSIAGWWMVGDARRRHVETGLIHAEAMLRGGGKVIKSWEKFVLVFPEVWLGPGGREYVWCLYPAHGYWQLNYDELRHSFNADYRLVSA